MSPLTTRNPPRFGIALLAATCALVASVMLAMAVSTVAAEGPIKIELRKVSGQSSDPIKVFDYDSYVGPKVAPGTKYTLSRGEGKKSTKWTVQDGVTLSNLLQANLTPEEYAQLKFVAIRWPGASGLPDDESGGPALYSSEQITGTKAVLAKDVRDAGRSVIGPVAFRSRGHYQLETAAIGDDNRFVIEVGIGEVQKFPIELRVVDLDHKSKEVRLTVKGVPRAVTGERYDFYFNENVAGVDDTESNLVGTAKHTYGSGVNYQPWVRVTAPDGSRGVATAPVEFEPTDKNQNPPSRKRGTGKGDGSGGATGGGTSQGGTGGTTPNGGTFQGPSTQGFQQGPQPGADVPPAPPITPPTLDQPLTQNPDQSRIADLAAAAGSPGGTYRTVSGIVLAGPSGQPVGGSGSAIPGAVSEVAETIFDTAKDPRALWPFLLALLFASWISGAVRELKRP